MMSGKKPFVIGIPTVCRKRNYLLETLKSLVGAMSQPDLMHSVIVILNADTHPENHYEFRRIRQEFSGLVSTGTLHLLGEGAKPAHRVAGDLASAEADPKNTWLRKQSLDCAALMAYCSGLGEYYLHLEDDVIARSGFASAIRSRIEQCAQARIPWTLLSFYNPYRFADGSQLTEFQLSHEYFGLIGKLVHSRVLPEISSFLLTHCDEQPVDALIHRWVLESGGKAYAHSPSLFQHVGVISSYQGQVQIWNSADYRESNRLRLTRYWSHITDVVRHHPRALPGFLRYKLYLRQSRRAGRSHL